MNVVVEVFLVALSMNEVRKIVPKEVKLGQRVAATVVVADDPNHRLEAIPAVNQE